MCFAVAEDLALEEKKKNICYAIIYLFTKTIIWLI